MPASKLKHALTEAITHPLIVAINDPSKAQEFTGKAWRRAISAAHNSGMMGVLSQRCDHLSLTHRISAWIDAGTQRAGFDAQMLALELRDARNVFRRLDVPAMFLKGAAYRAHGFAWSEGRISTDIDVLVRFDQLDTVEAALRAEGWEDVVDDDRHLDREYFRKWLHEIPPLSHPEHFAALDVHHNILPRTDPKCFDASVLWDAADTTPDGTLVPCPADLVLHSAAHLLRNGRFHRGIRDLYDIHCLLGSFSVQDEFWPTLFERGERTRLLAPFSLSARYAEALFATPIPPAIMKKLLASVPKSAPLIDRLIGAALLSRFDEHPDFRQRLAIEALAHIPPPRLRVMASPLFWKKRFTGSVETP